MTQPSGVLVLGAHRSGTSATTQVLHGLGLRIPEGDDLMGATPHNPTGYWESHSLTAFNDLVLCVQGGSWSALPALEPGWASGRDARWIRDAATRCFQRAFGEQPRWLWKDPRAPVMLDLWRAVLDPVAVLVWRDPYEVAASLRRRDGFTQELGLAIWERTTRSMLRDTAGLPTLVCRYDALLSDPERWADEAAAFLDEFGFAPTHSPNRAALSIDRSLRRASPDRSASATPDEQANAIARLTDCLSSLDGIHQSWPELELDDESTITRDALTTQRTQPTRRPMNATVARALLRANHNGRLDRTNRWAASASTHPATEDST